MAVMPFVRREELAPGTSHRVLYLAPIQSQSRGKSAILLDTRASSTRRESRYCSLAAVVPGMV